MPTAISTVEQRLPGLRCFERTTERFMEVTNPYGRENFIVIDIYSTWVFFHFLFHFIIIVSFPTFYYLYDVQSYFSVILINRCCTKTVLFVIILTICIFFKERTRANRTDTSPGSYDPLTSDFDQLKLKILKQKRISSRSDWAKKIAFTGTEKRFNEINNGISRDAVGDNGPSPGTYDPRTNISDIFQKSMKNSRPFGSNSGVSVY